MRNKRICGERRERGKRDLRRGGEDLSEGDGRRGTERRRTKKDGSGGEMKGGRGKEWE